MIPLLFAWVGSLHSLSVASSAIMNVLFFSFADDTIGAAWHDRKVSHELTHKH